MATHDYVIANASGAAVRADLNNALAAIVSNNSNATEPATMYAYQWWADTNAGILKFRNAANDAWIDIVQLDGEYTTIGLENGSAAAPSLFFKDSGTDTGLFSPGADSVAISTGGTQRVTTDSSGRLLVGTSTARANFLNGSVTALTQVEGSGSGTTRGTFSLINNATTEHPATFVIGRSNANTIGSNTLVNDDDWCGRIAFSGNDGTEFVELASISGLVDGTPGANDMPGRLVFSTTADGASSTTERLTINSDGSGTFGGIFRLSSGAYVGTASNTKRLDDSSNGSSSATLFIGNAAIQVSSDARLKENIEATSLDAISAIKKISVKDFTWNDPSDTSFNNRNARGKWTGLIAQELVEILPFIVNAPRKESDGSIDHDSEETWTLDQSQLCPVLIKAMQEAMERIEQLETKVAALEGGES